MLFPAEEERRRDEVERSPADVDFFFELEFFFDKDEERRDEVDFLDEIESAAPEAALFSSSCCADSFLLSPDSSSIPV